ncbi:MAG TPA: hypothetical protein VIY69_08450 [Candidatus Acidoferrales bacterium]
MRPKETILYGLGIAIAVLAAITAVVPPQSVNAGIDWPSPPFVSGSQLPAMMNSADTFCGNGRRCSDFEFNDAVDELQNQWAVTPQWVRSQCVASSTVPSIERCIVTQTRAWLNENPNRQAPWVKADFLGSNAQYAR